MVNYSALCICKRRIFAVYSLGRKRQSLESIVLRSKLALQCASRITKAQATTL